MLHTACQQCDDRLVTNLMAYRCSLPSNDDKGMNQIMGQKRRRAKEGASPKDLQKVEQVQAIR
ncbi:MAG: hypothetical protein KDD02_20425 [Phaeodactylibacter sp.]|nr:hypothetical protein [Phaeodactylibacter sp.]MCB9304417.1 hypothetical protein [Lewinellaceae bacterium]